MVTTTSVIVGGRQGALSGVRVFATKFGKQGGIHDLQAFSPFNGGRTRNCGQRMFIQFRASFG
jgi:hypothetical protein